MGKNVFIDYKVYFRYPGKIKIGNNVSINRGCSFFPSCASKDGTIVLGNNVRLGPNVTFFAAGHDHAFLDLPDTSGRIAVGDNVWIGGNATILKDVTIGEGAVVASGAVVTKNVPPYKIYGGVPAKEMKTRIIRNVPPPALHSV